MKYLPFFIRVKNRIKVIPRYDVPRIPTIVRGTFQFNLIKGYWCDCANFGDQITPLLLRHFNYTPLLMPPKRAKFVSTGSILEHLPDDYSGLILGSGFIRESSHRSFPKAQTLAVRGQLTKERLGLGSSQTVLFGDPGLLAANVIPVRERKQYALGIIPHYVDKNNNHIAKIAHSYHPQVTVIDVEQRDPLVVFKEIDKCEHVLASSLHGLIVSDSLGIPNSWFYSPGLEGDRFKFDDYYSSLGIPSPERHELTGGETLAELIASTTLKPRQRIDYLKQSLQEAFISLRTLRR